MLFERKLLFNLKFSMKKLLIFLFLWVSYISFSQNIIWDKFEDFTTKNISSKTTGQPMSISIA
ncbi:MAG TPA: hypothetical protein DCS66_09190, partial [Flavobacteriaceae bacterium]|nr:hypothetical protein [Flavobacteriaceae bacterium]